MNHNSVYKKATNDTILGWIEDMNGLLLDTHTALSLIVKIHTDVDSNIKQGIEASFDERKDRHHFLKALLTHAIVLYYNYNNLLYLREKDCYWSGKIDNKNKFITTLRNAISMLVKNNNSYGEIHNKLVNYIKIFDWKISFPSLRNAYCHNIINMRSYANVQSFFEDIKLQDGRVIKICRTLDHAQWSPEAKITVANVETWILLIEDKLKVLKCFHDVGIKKLELNEQMQ